jgi:2-C-methyl-D-erythritol 4-phosphate cytidylyltransferase
MTSTRTAPKFSAVIVAAGQSARFKDPNFKKPFAPLEGKAVWLHSADRFLRRGDVSQVILVIPPTEREDFLSRFGANVAVLGIDVVDGGAQRADSVRSGVAAARSDSDFIAIHDAARPCLSDAWLERLFLAAREHGAAILAEPVTSTVKRSNDGKKIEATVDRSGLWLAQTPQVFRRQSIIDALARFGSSAFTDEAQLMEKAGVSVRIVEGSPLNIKITTRQDLALAAAILKILPGNRLDAPLHPFAEDRLWR